jgi:hypothetical protein
LSFIHFYFFQFHSLKSLVQSYLTSKLKGVFTTLSIVSISISRMFQKWNCTLEPLLWKATIKTSSCFRQIRVSHFLRSKTRISKIFMNKSIKCCFLNYCIAYKLNLVKIIRNSVNLTEKWLDSSNLIHKWIWLAY